VLDFALGPVQTFVAQARRTRDLWGGSFLLSFLVGHAIAGARHQGAHIIFPAIDKGDDTVGDPLLAKIERRPLPHDPAPTIGSLPNRFRASVPADFDPTIVERVVHAAWQRIADAVWRDCLAPVVDEDSPTAAIWCRQTAGFWETAWVLCPPDDASDLDARKNWRLPASLEPEGGDHCSIMPDWQELSGVTRAGDHGQQCEFWQAVRETETVRALDLRPDEQLCAIAFIKRLFPRCAQEAIRWPVDARNWPSTAYMAAVPWIEDAFDKAPDHTRRYARSAMQWLDEDARGEDTTRLARLSGVERAFAGLTGNAFHQAALANERATPLWDEEQRDDACNELRTLQKAVGTQACPYYAVLLADGDRLGELVAQSEDSAEISGALARFSRTASACIAEHSGVTVYAGGDDVLALLPADTALAAARELDKAYWGAFADSSVAELATLSVGLVLAHYRQPLRTVLDTAHTLLDSEAKDRNGRASLAVGVFQSVGLNLRWRAAFESPAPAVLDELANRFKRDHGYLSGGFIQRLRHLTARLAVETRAEQDPWPPETLQSLLIAELASDREKGLDRTQCHERVRFLWPAIRYHGGP